jgi:TPP-dependent pyruvate/acetoin dehydrogenase alpha subunit
MPNRFLDLSQTQHLNLLRQLYTIRFFEEAAGRYYRKGMVKGGIHASIGQEAVAAGVCGHLSREDIITSTHRGHGHHIAKGADLDRLMAEILGKESGYCKGRGGSMHVASFDVGSLGAFPIVAAGLPSAVGAGLSAVLQKREQVVAAFFGDGALGQGTLYESLNLAAVWQLPVVFVCENNQYAVSTNCSTTLAMDDFAGMARSHGLPALKTDGQQVSAVFDTMAQALDILQEDHMPVFIQADTYRFEGHYFGEPEVNRDRDEVQKIRETRDPISLYRQWLKTQYGEAISTAIQQQEEAAQKAVDDACAFAEKSKDPDPENYAEFVYAD